MKIKFFYNQNFMNVIFLTLVPLMISANTVIRALFMSFSLIVVHILFNIAITLLHEKLSGAIYEIPAKLGVCIAIPALLCLILSVIFKAYSLEIINLYIFVTIAQVLLNTLSDIKYDSLMNNIKSCLPSVIILSVILIVICFIREVIGLGSLFGFTLPLGNLRPIGLFAQTSGGLLLLGILIALYSLLVKKNEEDER